MAEQRKDGGEQEARIATASLAVRYEARYEISIEIEVNGISRSGEVFHERSVTMDVSEWGCAFLLSVELNEDDIVSLCVIPKDGAENGPAEQAAFQVVRVRPVEKRWLIGAWKMESKDLWGAELQKINNHEEVASESGKDGIAGRAQRRRKDTD
jgi:hypothetical protein